jgi:streptomycin 6-kinase
MNLPQSLRDGVIAWEPDGQDWADSLPARLEHCRQLWHLRVGEPFEGGCTAWVAPAERADGSDCVLKLTWTGDESIHEAEALVTWNGEGAVSVIERDEPTHALLLERLLPGSSLLDWPDPDEALEIACGILRRLWVAPRRARAFPNAHEQAVSRREAAERRYAQHSQPFDRALLDAAVAAYDQLGRGSTESVILHQDFHRGNVLRAQREAWLAIDPKPLSGERAFDAHWLLRDLLVSEPRSAHGADGLLDRLAAALSLDAERIRLWTIARSIDNALWSCEVGEDARVDLALAAALL